MNIKPSWMHLLEVLVLVSFCVFSVYAAAQKVPALEAHIQSLDIRQSVTEAHYSDILKSLERIERRLK